MSAFRAFALLGVVALAGVLAFADEAKKKEDKKDDKKGDDATFVTKAVGGNLFEIEAGKVAQMKGTHPEVKAFSDMMIKDHAKANNELTGIAARKGMAVPKEMGKEQQDMLEKVKKADKDFDQTYAKTMVDSHTKSLELYETYSKDAKDDALREFAKKTAPTVKMHLDMAKALEGKLKK